MSSEPSRDPDCTAGQARFGPRHRKPDAELGFSQGRTNAASHPWGEASEPLRDGWTGRLPCSRSTALQVPPRELGPTALLPSGRRFRGRDALPRSAEPGDDSAAREREAGLGPR